MRQEKIKLKRLELMNVADDLRGKMDTTEYFDPRPTPDGCSLKELSSNNNKVQRTHKKIFK
jgi:hypothetical protein